MSQFTEDQQSKLTSKDAEGVILPQVKFIQCPIKTSLGVLGKKWTMLILRDIGFLKIVRFNRILESIPSLTPRVLSMRLRELEDEGFIECVGGNAYPDSVDCLWFQMAF